MFLSFAYHSFSAVMKLLVGRRRNEFAKDVELMVLRHQLVVLGRQAARPIDISFRIVGNPAHCPCGRLRTESVAAPTSEPRNGTSAGSSGAA
jgi:hypothetical protein